MKKIVLSVLFVFLLALVSVSAAGDLSVDIDTSSQSGEQGTDVTYVLTLSNTGASTIDAITITSTDLSDGTHSISAPDITDITLLEVGVDQTVDVIISLPAGSYAGTYSGTITATDDADALNTEEIAYEVTVNVVESFSVDVSELNFDLLADQTEDIDLLITNTGTVDLTSWDFVFTSDDGDSDFAEDNDDDRVDFSYSASTDPLTPGSSMTISVTVDAESDLDEGSYDGTLKVSTTGLSAVEKDLPVDLTISPSICEDGKVGNDIEINIEEPDSGDNYSPGDTVTVEFEIDNKGDEDLDFDIEIILYNEDDGKKVKTVREEVQIDEDESEDVSVDIELPSDLDDDDTYYIYVQVHEEGNEDDSCDFEKVRIDIELEDEDAKISEVSVSPSSNLVCSDEYTVTVEVESTGKKDLENLFIELLDSDLDLSESSSLFDLGDHNDDDNDFRTSFDVVIPSDLGAGEYYIEVVLRENSGSQLDSELVLVEVGACGGSNPIATPNNDGTLGVTVADDFDVTGDELTLSLVLENNGDSTKEFEITVDEITWADLDSIEMLESLGPGDESRAYLYFTLDSTTAGEHDMKIIVTDNEGNVVEEIVTVDFGAQKTDEKKDLFGDLFNSEKGSSVTWIVLDIVLVVLALVFLSMLLRKR
jgi:hypothetical protein